MRSGTPSRFSNCTILSLTVDGERPSRFAAARNPRISQTLRNTARSSRDPTSSLFAIAIRLSAFQWIIRLGRTAIPLQLADCIEAGLRMEMQMTIKTALITGANKSIGFETARQLGRLDYRIWLGCRDEARGAAAAQLLSQDGIEVTPLSIDVTSEVSIRAAAAVVQEQDGKLDVLINNAGISNVSFVPPSQQTIDDVRTVYDTNVFGPIRVTQAFLPLLKAAGSATVVMVSSGLGSLAWLSDPTHPFYGVNLLGYNSSKTALNAVTLAFAKELSSFNIRVDAADPGYTATDFNNHSGYRTVEQAAAGIVWLVERDGGGPTGRFYFETEQAPW
ncbi:SDR family oxidoreductase [Lichenihabitans psoromatis]|uniref:SDR family oxidoreductase n=2 Tax=Lichenihabitans psoromatis TaxID=2528642 RepID=UPI001FE09519|nr:SDR family oxidoreductase [Lichenihabitans psoromatis]